MDETDLAFDGDHLDRILPNVEIKDGARIGEHIAERTGGLNDCFVAFIVKTCHPGSHVSLRYLDIEGDELNLGAVAVPDPGPVGND
jgi:hypothetical protein